MKTKGRAKPGTYRPLAEFEFSLPISLSTRLAPSFPFDHDHRLLTRGDTGPLTPTAIINVCLPELIDCWSSLSSNLIRFGL